eukprot:15442248-Alexandrium_andersonii.AAC.1
MPSSVLSMEGYSSTGLPPVILTWRRTGVGAKLALAELLQPGLDARDGALAGFLHGGREALEVLRIACETSISSSPPCVLAEQERRLGPGGRRRLPPGKRAQSSATTRLPPHPLLRPAPLAGCARCHGFCLSPSNIASGNVQLRLLATATPLPPMPNRLATAP